jgi:hypothetical protein
MKSFPSAFRTALLATNVHNSEQIVLADMCAAVDVLPAFQARSGQPVGYCTRHANTPRMVDLAALICFFTQRSDTPEDSAIFLHGFPAA